MFDPTRITLVGLKIGAQLLIESEVEDLSAKEKYLKFS
jgi:hypothetical protein